MTGHSLRAAIDAKCKSCIYDPGDCGNWREQVSGCSSGNCPLHAVRPISAAHRRELSRMAMTLGEKPLSALHGPKSGLPGPAFGITEGGAR